ncbi:MULTISPECIES: TetR/AcrR family transcriptional regulator [Mycolicibacterium]|uniref:TetR family transcriptional regulator n=2 Tax=Mycolicibacterium TaxID=1866885 RepID=A0A4Z0HTE9_MYCPR|nr:MULTISPECIES: TetR/AcrR family transcriptional regulator C-terminal domain-containing protein [Mycolicibacterium]CDO30910.1 TetR family transcriptional regulator [Mycolicibacterium vulneris]MCV7388753.1 TetR/AcrR family transcriptional regulator C-terminal domain-containing protein [Mycolicibacterium porcinum]ORB34857.1 TetR family transcriptional regulator [Mycolicibacterium porcinum]TGB45537.1 TetR family transcriptional regulator [Mycolicibacterium peregrinum]TGB47731.1 TetR family trans
MSEIDERGYRNFLRLEAIVGEARAIADIEGLQAVSMRALAERLGCTPRALYRHVADKDSVLELMADQALADIPTPSSAAPWQTALSEFFTDMYDLLAASPAVATVISQQAVTGEHFRAHADLLVGRLLEAGLPAALAAEAVVTLAQFTLGASLPGTSQRLHDLYRGRGQRSDEQAFPALAHVAVHFTDDDAANRFRTALRRLIGAYEQH